MHKKQIEQTLNELHKLQSEIYELQVTDNPHSSPPVKRQIKQLAYLYENMTRPRQLNRLEVNVQDIKAAFDVISESKYKK